MMPKSPELPAEALSDLAAVQRACRYIQAVSATQMKIISVLERIAELEPQALQIVLQESIKPLRENAESTTLYAEAAATALNELIPGRRLEPGKGH